MAEIKRVNSDGCEAVESLVGQIADQYADRLARGEVPDVEEYGMQHPELAEKPRRVLPALQLIHAHPADAAEKSQPQVQQLSATKRLGDFRLIREIGRSGMGVVYEAEQVSLERRVALKVLPMAGILDDRQLTRFKNEARAAATLLHPNIVPVFAVGSDSGTHFYAMQFVDGPSLTEVIATLAQEAEVAVAAQQSEAGQQSNRQLSVPKCFGARPTGVASQVTPEEISGATAICKRSKLFQQVTSEDPPQIRKSCPSVPRDLETIVFKAIAKSPQDRYATAGELAADLRRFLDDKPIHAQPPGFWEIANKWRRRNQAVVATALTTLILAIALAGIFLRRERSVSLSALAAEHDQRSNAKATPSGYRAASVAKVPARTSPRVEMTPPVRIRAR